MTKIDIYKTGDGFIKKFIVEDHTGVAPAGSDVACAAISTITQAVIIGTEAVIKYCDFDYTVADGYLECEFKDNINSVPREKIRILTDTMYLVLLQVKEQYESYVDIVEHTL